MNFSHISNFGPNGCILNFGETPSSEISREIFLVFNFLKNQNYLNVIPAFTTITIHSAESIDCMKLDEQIRKFLTHDDSSIEKNNLSHWSLPICYDEEFALDIKRIEEETYLPFSRYISDHLNLKYSVYFIGFMPGFPYMGEITNPMCVPRLSTPRTSIPERSVGVADNFTCIYPKNSPGGWNIIGKIPFKIFDITDEQGSLLLPGDVVKFHQIQKDEFLLIEKKSLSFEDVIKVYQKNE